MDALAQSFAETPAVVALFFGLAGWVIGLAGWLIWVDWRITRRARKRRAKRAEQTTKARLEAAKAQRQQDPVTFEPTCLDDPPERRQN